MNYEFSDSAVREANPPVNSGDISSVDGPGGWRRAPLYCASRVEGPLSWQFNTVGGGTGVLLLPRSPEGRGEGMVKRKNEKDVKTWPGCTLDFHEEGSKKGLKKTSAV